MKKLICSLIGVVAILGGSIDLASARSAKFVSPSTASAVVVGVTSKGNVVVLPTMAGAAIKLGGPGTVAVHARFGLVYAAPEWGRRSGQLVTASLTGRRLKELGILKLGATGSVSIALSPDEKSLVVANYGSGTVSVVTLDARGIPTAVANMALPMRASLPHAVVFVGSTALITDLKNDRLEFLSISDGAPKWIGSVSMRTGDGPRSIAKLSDQQLLVSNENSNTVSCLVSTGASGGTGADGSSASWIEKGRLSLIQPDQLLSELASGPAWLAPGTKGQGKPAEIVATSSTGGAVVVRNPDEIIRFSVSASCQMAITNRDFDVADSPRALASRGPEVWMPNLSAVMVSNSSNNWGAIPTRDPLYSIAVVR
jgi:DNA-binding beta-propeller fold protein YncE